MRPEELVALIGSAFCRITGDDYVPDEQGKELFAMLSVRNDSVIRETIKLAPKEYSGMKKYPEESFWAKIIAREQRNDDIKTGRAAIVVQKPSEEERRRVAQQAAEIAEKFRKMSPQYAERKSVVRERVERMAEQARLGMVMVETMGHALEGVFIPKGEAEEAGLLFLDPCDWLDERKTVSRW